MGQTSRGPKIAWTNPTNKYRNRGQRRRRRRRRSILLHYLWKPRYLPHRCQNLSLPPLFAVYTASIRTGFSRASRLRVEQVLFRRGKNPWRGAKSGWTRTKEEEEAKPLSVPLFEVDLDRKRKDGAVRGRGMRIVTLLMDALLDFCAGNARLEESREPHFSLGQAGLTSSAGPLQPFLRLHEPR